MFSKSHCKIAYDDDVDMDEFEDFYDFSSTYDGEDEGEDGDLVSRTLEVSNIGELILLDGRTVGHRDLNKYYKQRVRPVDHRPCILALKREELLRLQSLYGSVKMDPTAIERLSDAQMVSLLRHERKQERKAQMIAQRASQKLHFQNQRREYKSNVDALRSRANRADQVIRDYHSRLV